MCGRAKLSTDFSEIRIVFRLPPDRPLPNFAPTYNLAPTDPIPIVRCDDWALAAWAARLSRGLRLCDD
jgi:putative SOS response-associated peptidase YedK